MAKFIWVNSKENANIPQENFWQQLKNWYFSIDKFYRNSMLILGAILLISVTTVGLVFDYRSHASTATINLSVDYNAATTPFNKNVLGQGYVDFALGRLVNSSGANIIFDAALVPGLIQATNLLSPGVIRIGGAWINQVGWTRTVTPSSTCREYCDWTAAGSTMPYHFAYYPALIDKLVQETAELGGTKLLLGINASDGNPAMWADLVSYVKSQKTANALDYNQVTIYYELGNELDLNNTLSYSTYPSISLTHIFGQDYVNQFNPYQQAMLAADAKAQIVGPDVSTAQDVTWSNTGHGLSSDGFMSPFFGYLATQSAAPLPMVTTHWYEETCQLMPTTTSIPTVLNWQTFSGINLNNDPNNGGSRHYADILAGKIRAQELANSPSANAEIAVDEQNVDGCVNASNNYQGSVFNGDWIGALYFADVLPRMSYNGVNYATHYEGYGIDNLSLIYPDNNVRPSRIYLRPSYIPFLLYANFFDSNMLPVSPLNDPTAVDITDKNSLSVWASKDANNSEINFIVTNMTAATSSAAIIINNFPSTQIAGNYYQLLSSATTATSIDLTATDSSSVTINGSTIDPMNIAQSFNAISPLQVQSTEITNSVFTHTYPAYSITVVRLFNGATAAPTPYYLPVPTVIPTLTPTPTSKPTPTPTPDTILPTVSITSPVSGSAARGSTLSIMASASDNVGVKQVVFLVNNAIVCTDTLAPYACAWKVPGKPGASYTITAQASDAAGNMTKSAAVSIFAK